MTSSSHWCRRQWIRLRLAKALSNWRDVWRAYACGDPLPPFRLRNGITLYHGPKDGPVFLLFDVFSDGCYRKGIGSRLEGTLIDIGANIGSVVLDWGWRSPELRVHAYEPNPEAFGWLRRNVVENGLGDRVTLYPEAVGARVGRFALDVASPSLAATGYGPSTRASAEIVDAPMVDLNEVARRVGASRIELLKIDAEGAEADILMNAATETLQRIERVYLEYHDHLVPESAARCLRRLETAGFRCRRKKLSDTTGILYAVRKTTARPVVSDS